MLFHSCYIFQSPSASYWWYMYIYTCRHVHVCWLKPPYCFIISPLYSSFNTKFGWFNLQFSWSAVSLLLVNTPCFLLKSLGLLIPYLCSSCLLDYSCPLRHPWELCLNACHCLAVCASWSLTVGRQSFVIADSFIIVVSISMCIQSIVISLDAFTCVQVVLPEISLCLYVVRK